MEVFERINTILKNKNITKREFAKRLRDLEPCLHSTGEIPSEKTIYKYLNGTISIKIELITYIAEVLQISEQELFTHDKKSRKKFFQNIIKTASEDEINIIRQKYELSFCDNSYIKEPTNIYNQHKYDELLELLPYAPKPILDNFINKLKELKEYNETL